DGRLPAESYTAMERIEAAGLMLIPITGRPAGWCDHIARMWPVHGVVGENGAFWFRYDRSERRMHRYFAVPEHERRAQAARLRAVAADILREVPGARVAADQPYREADLAIDFCEDVPRLPDSEVERIVSVMQAHGLTVKVSSIHVNGWFGGFDKRSSTLHLLDRAFGVAAAAARGRYAFIGDSPNDEPMFEFFDCSIGVANILEFGGIRSLPRYVTDGRGSTGFVEFTRRLLSARGSRSA